MAAINFDKLSNFFKPIHVTYDGRATSTGDHPSLLPTILTNVIYLFLYFGAVIMVLAILYGGIMYITAGGDEAKTTKGRNSILYGIIGGLVIILSFVILNIVRGLVENL